MPLEPPSPTTYGTVSSQPQPPRSISSDELYGIWFRNSQDIFLTRWMSYDLFKLALRECGVTIEAKP